MALQELEPKRRFIIKGKLDCKSPSDLLRSRIFANVLSLFNAHFIESTDFRPQKPFTVEDIVRDPELAERLYDFYKTEVINGNMQLGIHRGKKTVLNGLIAYTRKAIRENRIERLLDEERENAPAPEWIRKAWPGCPSELPTGVVQELELHYQRLFGSNYLQDTVNIPTDVIQYILNNFNRLFLKRGSMHPSPDSTLLVNRGLDGEWAEIYPKSAKLNEIRWCDFHQDLDRAMAETGLSMEDLQAQKGSRAKSLYLLPAFIRLMTEGYHAYPDLSS